MPLKIRYLPISEIVPDSSNPRRHGDAQIRLIADSIIEFGFTAPILTDKRNKIIVGHARYEGAKVAGLTEVPVICLEDLSSAQAAAYKLTDNRLQEFSTWDKRKLARCFQELRELCVNLDIQVTGFKKKEIGLRIQSLRSPAASKRLEQFELPTGKPVTCPGELWFLGPHRIYCGDATDTEAYEQVLEGQNADLVIADLPQSLNAKGNSSRGARARHCRPIEELRQMDGATHSALLANYFSKFKVHTKPEALMYAFMDQARVAELNLATLKNGLHVTDLCIWVRDGAPRLGSLYKAKHELVFVLENDDFPKPGGLSQRKLRRARSNVWPQLPNGSRSKKHSPRARALDQIVKPASLMMDIIEDSIDPNDVVLDPFGRCGSTLLAAEVSGRRAAIIEKDPLHVDCMIVRWQSQTGTCAFRSDGKSFSQMGTLN